MIHRPTLVAEIRELPPEDGWACYEDTGRATVVCSCGLNTGWIQRSEASAAARAHPRSPTSPRSDGTTKATALLATVLWFVVAAATTDLLLTGNPTAPNAILGAGIGALALTATAVALRRQDRRL
ncbi:hypothetical protein [Streptomyces scabiei]|uniref:hypothetical protein n=1 Tax=Streptomyces scabiei TaxID=1930 RepID=UPI000765B304|nr:hypothetical protein [Streptomyces scabiei]